jgi:hypothetical protein
VSSQGRRGIPTVAPKPSLARLLARTEHTYRFPAVSPVTRIGSLLRIVVSARTAGALFVRQTALATNV